MDHNNKVGGFYNTPNNRKHSTWSISSFTPRNTAVRTFWSLRKSSGLDGKQVPQNGFVIDTSGLSTIEPTSYPSSVDGGKQVSNRSLQTTVEEAPFSFDIQLETSNNASSSASSGASRLALLVLMAASAASLL